MIKDNVISLQRQISHICNRLGRNAQEITLVGITKYVEAHQVRELVDAGITHIGENRVMDAKAKFQALTGLSMTKHLVGHLQTNKVKLAVEWFDLIHSVDSAKLVLAIEQQAEKVNKKVNILLQVNTAFEDQKYGLAPDAVRDVIRKTADLSYVRIQGLMTMAPFVEEKEVIRACFRDLKEIFENLKRDYPQSDTFEMKYLSMGMTSDFEIALEEGANMLRIGRALFH